MTFRPRVSPENFRAAFTAAEGWDTFSQKQESGSMTADIAVKYGRLRLQTLELQVPEGVETNKLEVVANGRSVSCAVSREGGHVVIRLDEPVTLSVGQSLCATFPVKR